MRKPKESLKTGEEMILRVNEYEGLSADNVDVFLDLFLNRKFFGKIVVLKTKELRNISDYRIRKQGERHITIDTIEEAINLRESLSRSSDYDGDMSILYVPKNASEFLEQLLEGGQFLEAKPRIFDEKHKAGKGYFGPDWLVNFILSDVFISHDEVFAFSHDANFLCQFFRQ